MRIDRAQMLRSCENDMSEANLSFIERLPSSPDLPHCCPAIGPPTAHGTQFSFRFQESLQAPILHRFFPETPSPLANPKNRIIERPSPPALADNLSRIRECWRADTPKELACAAFGRHVSQKLAFGTDAQDIHIRNGLSHWKSNRRLLLQWDGEMELERTKDETAGPTKEVPDAKFMPPRKRLFTQKEPNNVLLQLQSAGLSKELELVHNRNAHEQMLSAQFIGGAFGSMSPGNSSSKWKTGISRSEDYREVQVNRGSWGSQLHMGGDRFSRTVTGISNPFQVHQEEEQNLCLDLTLSSQPISKEIKLPIAPHCFNPAIYRDIGHQALSFNKQSEGPRRIDRKWEFVHPVPADCCNLNHSGFEDRRQELRNPESLQHGIGLGAAWAFESKQRMLVDGNVNFQLSDGAGESNGAGVNFQLSKGAADPLTVLSAPFSKERVPCTSENKIPRIVALPDRETGKLISEEERLLACVEPTLPPLFCGFAIGKQQHSDSTIKKVEVDREDSTLKGSSKGDGETEISHVQGSCVESEVSYELTGMMRTEMTTPHADGLGRSESLDTTEYYPVFSCPRPDNIEAQIDGTGWSEDSTCRSKPANGRMEMLPSRICSQGKKLPRGESHAEGAGNTHGALDLLVDAVQVALSPITETCAKTDERQEGLRADTFVHGSILIPQKRVNRQARSTGRRKKAPTMEPVYDKLQIVKVEHETPLACDEIGRSNPQETLQDTDIHEKQFKSSLALISLEGKEFFDPFIESKRGRIRTLPSKFRDSVLEPWKKGTWKKYRAQQL